MRLIFTAVSIFALCFLPAFAQSERRVAECDGLAEWYADVDAESFQSAFENTLETKEDLNVILEMTEPYRLRSGLEPCMQAAIQYIGAGWRGLFLAAEYYIDGDMDNFTQYYLSGVQSIGELRGYVAALGIEPFDDNRYSVYFK